MNLRQQIIQYLQTHPGSGTFDIACELDQDLDLVITTLRELQQQGQVHRDAFRPPWEGLHIPHPDDEP